MTGLDENESLSSGGSTTVTVFVVDESSENAEYLGSSDIFFTSTCAQVGLAEFTPSKLQASGTATATYKDKGCGKVSGSDDNIVVTLGSEDDEGNITSVATARATINVEAAVVGAIQYVQADPSLIALMGFGTSETPSLTKVEFQVVDVAGNPMPDRTVTFSLDHEYGSAELSLESAITGQDGKVLVILNAGNVAGTVRIKAGVDILKVDSEGVVELDSNQDPIVDHTVTTMSAPIVMATSLGDQNSFSLASTEFNPRAWNYDGTQVTITAHLGDHNQNPVLDGTLIYFTATGGLIEPSCETVKGACPVTWTSANPRPIDGYVKILAHTRGQGDYQDANRNGLFDLGESFQSYAEAWVDANGNGTYESDGAYQPQLDIDGEQILFWDAAAYEVYVSSNGTYTKGSSNFYEEFIDSDNSGTFDKDPTAFYQGVNCSDAAVAEGHCAQLMDVTKSLTLQMSAGNDYFVEGPFLWDAASDKFDTSTEVSCVDVETSNKTVGWRIADSRERRNHLPLGTKISFSGTDAGIDSESGSGSMANTHPPAVLPVWEAYWDANPAGPANDFTTDKKYDYLNARGTMVWVTIKAPDSATKPFGTMKLQLDLLNGLKVIPEKGVVTVDIDAAFTCP